MKKKALIIQYQELVKYDSIFKKKKTVLVGGCFDLIHFGHLKYLEKAREEGDFLIVALESDEFIKKHKRKVPVHQQPERAEILAYLNMVDLVVCLPFFKSNEDYRNLVKKISPKVIAITVGDSQIKNKNKQALEVGAKVKEVVINLKNFSTRNIAKVFNL
jgi:rfaE bifunctional protein nucleotidyltransferase chain/domain